MASVWGMRANSTSVSLAFSAMREKSSKSSLSRSCCSMSWRLSRNNRLRLRRRRRANALARRYSAGARRRVTTFAIMCDSMLRHHNRWLKVCFLLMRFPLKPRPLSPPAHKTPGGRTNCLGIPHSLSVPGLSVFIDWHQRRGSLFFLGCYCLSAFSTSDRPSQKHASGAGIFTTVAPPPASPSGSTPKSVTSLVMT